MSLAKSRECAAGRRSRVWHICRSTVFLFAVSAAIAANGAAQIYTISAPNGVGDVAALTNVLANLPDVSNNDYNGSRIWL